MILENQERYNEALKCYLTGLEYEPENKELLQKKEDVMKRI